MTPQEFDSLQPGDVFEGMVSKRRYTVKYAPINGVVNCYDENGQSIGFQRANQNLRSYTIVKRGAA